MKYFVAFIVLLSLWCNMANAVPVLDDNLIAEVNSKQKSWVAGRNSRFEGMELKEARKLMCGKPTWDGVRRYSKIDASLPASFDARTQWPTCIGAIRNQEQCGSCWAFSSSEVLADRWCIGGGSPIVLSPEYILECDTLDDGCDGGNLDTVWKFLTETGTVTDACDPYVSGGGNVPACPKACTNGAKLQTYHAKDAQHITGVDSIMSALQANGPVQVAFSVYQDFFSYTSGVYVHTSGGLVGGHAVKFVGWGFDSSSNQPYWIVANSWGTSWGLQGFFWILRGANECGIESDVWAGVANETL